MPSGFLVVLEPRVSRNTGKLYAGVGRVPPYPGEVPREERAMDEYVFGGLKDAETNMIPSFEVALRLWKMLSEGGRGFEIIYCRDAERPISCSGVGIEDSEFLGYDIATVCTEYWSIVEDFSPSTWAVPYRRRLNGNGLFAERADAVGYLRDYRAHGEFDADFPFEVVEVARITPRS